MCTDFSENWRMWEWCRAKSLHCFHHITIIKNCIKCVKMSSFTHVCWSYKPKIDTQTSSTYKPSTGFESFAHLWILWINIAFHVCAPFRILQSYQILTKSCKNWSLKTIKIWEMLAVERIIHWQWITSLLETTAHMVWKLFARKKFDHTPELCRLSNKNSAI